MDSIASASIKYGSKRTRELFFSPPDLKFWLLSALQLSSNDSRLAEMSRLRPYYRGTRLLASIGMLLILPAFLIPLTAPFLGFNGALMLVVLYFILVLVLCFIALFLEVSLDALFAIRHEAGCGFSEAIKTFIRFVRNGPVEAAGYMGAKLLVDTGAMTLVSLLFLPALFTMVFVLTSVLHALEAGQAVSRTATFGGLALVMVLSIAAVCASALMSVPLSAFYGYYTEEAVRRIRKA